METTTTTTTNIDNEMSLNPLINTPIITYSRSLAGAKEKYMTSTPENYEKVCSNYKECCEIIPDDRPVKLYFDLDCKGELNDEKIPIDNNFELRYEPEIHNIALDAITVFCKEIMKTEPDIAYNNASSEYFISCKDGKPKWALSYHYIVNNVIALKSHQKKLVKELNDYIYQRTAIKSYTKLKNILDESVYEKNKKMRSSNCSKPNENRFLKIEQGTFNKTVISSFIPENAIIYEREDMEIKAPELKAPEQNINDYDFKKVNDFIEAGVFDRLSGEYKDWVNMGFALFNSFDDENGWTLFNAFSNRNSKYDEDKNKEWWDKMVASIQPEKKLTIKSIFKWAKDEDKDEYNRINEKYKKQKQREIKEDGDDNNYKKVFNELSTEFEKKHALIINRSVYIKDTPDEVILMTQDKLNSSYSFMECGKRKGTPVSFIGLWTKCNNNIRKYEDINVFPDGLKCPDNMFNLWKPFKINTFKGDYIPNEDAKNKFLHLIKVLCDNEDEVYNYILKWVAHMIQYPYKKSIVPTFISNEGAGKGTFLELMSRIMGKKKVFETSNPSRDVWGNFNELMTSTFLVNLNELSRRETLENEGKIKNLITDPNLTINPKGKAQYIIQSYHRFLITTNEEQPVATKNDDRRNLIIRSSDELISNKEFFTELRTLMEDEAVIRTMGDYFKSLDVKENFNEYIIPKTKYQDDLKEASRPAHELWLCGLIAENSNKESIKFMPCDLFNNYKEYCENNGIKYDGMNSIKLGIKINNLFKPSIRDSLLITEKSGRRQKIFYIKPLIKHFNIDTILKVNIDNNGELIFN